MRYPETGGGLQPPAAADAAGWTGQAAECDARYRRSRPEGEENLLTTSFALLSLAVVLGALLLGGQALRARPVHGLLGAAGVAAACLAALQGGLRGGFGGAVLGLLLVALCGGVVLWRGGRLGLVVFLHVMAGGVAYLLLIGVVFPR